MLSGQYENGGWPQFWPGPRGYQVHITFNDDAIVNTLNMIRDMMNHKAPYEDDLIDKALCVRLGKAFNKGIECILATQIIKDGEPSVWCQQNDRETLNLHRHVRMSCRLIVRRRVPELCVCSWNYLHPTHA